MELVEEEDPQSFRLVGGPIITNARITDIAAEVVIVSVHIMWGLSFYCYVSHRCCTLTITTSAAMSVIQAFVMMGPPTRRKD